MCFSQKAPTPPPVQPAPTRDTVRSSVNDSRRRSSEQQGVYGNIFTSALGDSSYGTSTAGRPKLARLGGSPAPAASATA